MMFHIIIITGITVMLLIAMFLPFLPGGYDGLSVTVSTMIQLLALAGLAPSLIGLLWLIYDRLLKTKVARPKVIYRFAVAAWLSGLLVAIIISTGAFIHSHQLLGFIIWIIIACLAIYTWRSMQAIKHAGYMRVKPVPLYLVCIPVILFITRLLFIEQAVSYSRSRAISQAAPLIQDIEAYHAKNGHYPVSLLSVWEDYKPGVLGIERYRYELNGTAYNLYFEQFSQQLSAREFVMYNKAGQHTMTSHNQDLLLLEPSALNMQRGYFAVQELSQPNWKCFLFD